MSQKTIRSEPQTGQQMPIVRVSWETIQGLTKTLTRRIRADGTPDILIGLQRGGLIPTVLLSHQLAVPEVLALPIRRTTSDDVYAAKQAPRLIVPEQAQSIPGKDVVIVDDIAGSGATLQAVWAALASYRPARLREAVYLVNLAHWESVHSQLPEQQMTYIGQEIRGWAIFPWERNELPLSSQNTRT